ncbi:excinuclease ABC subunit UvrC [Candidatus Fermentibacteria bacterium]|nr:excinuclease ABC subunit UvrC [Candidatus Fermentibacteria bacterium]
MSEARSGRRGTLPVSSKDAPDLFRIAIRDIRRQPGLLPSSPGVYLFRDEKGEILYIGKADCLRDRVRSYLIPDGPTHPRTRRLMERARTIETMVTANRREALVLEATLVRRHKPAYNVNLRDGQRYPYVCFTGPPFPRVVVTRVPSSCTGPCHGPYTDVRSLRDALRILRTVIPLRTCSDRQLASRTTPCILYQMQRCIAPCVNPRVADEYKELVRRASRVLEGHVRQVVCELRLSIDTLAAQLRYEEAAAVRDRITALTRLTQRQRVVLKGHGDVDAVAIARAGPMALATVHLVRDGFMVGQRIMPLRGVSSEMSSTDLIEAFVTHYYATAFVPPLILVGEALAAGLSLESWLGEARGGRVRVRWPRHGVAAELVCGAGRNAQKALEEELTKAGEWKARVPSGLVRLMEVLNLASPPRLIVGMDISHFSGGQRVGSLVVFEEGRPRRDAYRRYRINSPARDDSAMLAELGRRWGIRVASGELDRPGLVLVDGGEMQVDAVMHALAEYAGLNDIPVVGLAKREEVLYHGTPQQPLRLSRRDQGLQLLQRVRDEAHRFALAFHRSDRHRVALKSQMDDLPGIGARRAAALLERFGGIERLRRASRDDIMQTPGIGPRIADSVMRALGRS